MPPKLPPQAINDKAGLAEGGQIGGQIGGQTEPTTVYLTDRQKEVLTLIEEDNTISRKGIAHKLGIAESAVQKHLKALTSGKRIERVGTNKGYWKILSNNS